MDNQINFEQQLIQKYPGLFYKKEDGTLECPCGAWVPRGWESIVDELCGSITNYTKGTYRSKCEITSKKYYFWSGVVDILNWVYKWLFVKLFPKYNKCKYNKSFYSFLNKFRSRSHKHVKYLKDYPPAVKIDQIKEKFGELRFYYSGGDEQVAGMVRFAEYLCSKTCEVSGEKGQLCIRGNWYKTLSEKVRNMPPYEEYAALS
jgi:hypothetical protein